MNELTIDLNTIDPVELLGVNNSKLSLLKKAYPRLKILSRGHQIKITGNEDDVEMLRDKIMLMLRFIEKYGELTEGNIVNLLMELDPTTGIEKEIQHEDILVYGTNGKIVRARSEGQKKMVELCDENDIVFAVGPAGTGKTYTAVALAVRALKAKQIKKIILTRPAVEAGESLGFLPGDLKEKVDPYLRPLYDALDDMIPPDKLNYFMQNRVIEIAPLAFMRGRTLDNAYIILDEAQNCTSKQLKMFLTRIGPHAKAVITGDMTQIDLPHHQESGLFNAIDLLKDVTGIGTIYLDYRDVIRHKLVKEIIKRYDAEKKVQ